MRNHKKHETPPLSLLHTKPMAKKLPPQKVFSFLKTELLLELGTPLKAQQRPKLATQKGKPIPYHAYMEPTNSTMWLNLKLQT